METMTAYMLRTTDAQGRSYGGFLWPREVGAIVEAPDWSPEPECGHGLHGALHGVGDGSLLSWRPGALWWIIAVDPADVVDLGGKVKVPRGRVRMFGPRDAVVAEMQRLCPGVATIAGTATAGYGGTATAGYGGTATAGDDGTATAGDGGTATAGYGGTATAGDGGTATAGARGTATAGYAGTATAGYAGTATAGYDGTATAGDDGTIMIWWHDGKRCRMVIGYVGEDGIEPRVGYRVQEGKLVRATLPAGEQ